MTETVAIIGEGLKRVVEMKALKIKDALKGMVEDVGLELDENVNGKNVHLIQITDKTISLTTITCHETGFNIHWGSGTPSNVKTIVNDIMNGE
ncbi:hypothetical protein [Priestia megaterium]|uniref:hypothetical protein n=1 Tax=Priestia megaterium TaxID=1404 RepID=UPI00196B6DE5|nr:hypothetical protein [Priestia megaterium]QSF38463.1 hypothetical protein ICR96_23955 [Priestia megaterium]